MTIAYGSASGWDGQNGNSISPQRPPGTVNGDLLLLIVATESSESHVTPSGWNLVGNAHNGVTFDKANISIYSKTAANEPSSYTVQVTNSNVRGLASICRFTGTNLTVDQVNTATGGFTTTINAAAITPTQTPSMLVMASAIMSNLNDRTQTPPVGMSEVNDGAYYNLNAAVDYEAISGTSSTGVQTATATAAGYWGAILLNIYEGTSPGGGGGGTGGTAASTTFTPTGTIAATDVQSAIAEVASEALQASTLTTKGDLVARGAGGPLRHAVGANGLVLTADSTQATGLSWTSVSGASDTTAWPTYTPTLTASPSNPSLGTGGSITGHYKLYGKVLHFQIEVLVGTGPSSGSGTYNFSLPVGVTTANYNQTGTAWFVDASVASNAGHFIGVALVGPAATAVTAYLAGGGVNAPGTSFGGGSPVALGSGDTFVIGGTIEVQ